MGDFDRGEANILAFFVGNVAEILHLCVVLKSDNQSRHNEVDCKKRFYKQCAEVPEMGR